MTEVFGGDEEFLRKLHNFLPEENVSQICEHYNKPVTNAHINPRTRRQRIGFPSTRPRKILKPDSLKNYKSIILKFCRFKVDKIGVDSPITTEIALQYGIKLNDGRISHQTLKTNINVLNKNIVFPTTGQEIGMPRPIYSLTRNPFSNKPKFSHTEIALAVLQMFKFCRNRDHAHKVFLLYITGLRSHEAASLTFRDIRMGFSKNHAVIPVRLGKHNQSRNVVIFQGAPMVYYRQYFLPYLASKMAKLISDDDHASIEDYQDERIFSKSNYHACIKSFGKYLQSAVEEVARMEKQTSTTNGEMNGEDHDEEDQNNNDLKGSGLHSIRADFATRTVELLFSQIKNHIITAQVTARLLGQRLNKILSRHYMNWGMVDEKLHDLILDRYKELPDTSFENDSIMSEAEDDIYHALFNGCGDIIKRVMKNKKRKMAMSTAKLFQVEDKNHLLKNRTSVSATEMENVGGEDGRRMASNSHGEETNGDNRDMNINEGMANIITF